MEIDSEYGPEISGFCSEGESDDGYFSHVSPTTYQRLPRHEQMARDLVSKPRQMLLELIESLNAQTELVFHVIAVEDGPVVRRLVKFLDDMQLKDSAAEVLLRIVCECPQNFLGLVMELVSENRLVSKYVLLYKYHSTRDKAALALEILAASYVTLWQILEHEDFLKSLGQLKKDDPLDNQKITARTLLNFYDDKFKPAFKKVRPALRALRTLVYSEDEEVLINACATIYYLSAPNDEYNTLRGIIDSDDEDSNDDDIQEIINSDVCLGLVALLEHESSSVLSLALRCVGKIVSDVRLSMQISTICTHLRSLLTKTFNEKFGPVCQIAEKIVGWLSNEQIQIGICEILKNILRTRNSEQIKAVFDAGLTELLVKLLDSDDLQVLHWVAWTISDAFENGTADQIKLMVEKKFIEHMSGLLDSGCPLVITCATRGLGCLMHFAEEGDADYYAERIKELNVGDKVKQAKRKFNHLGSFCPMDEDSFLIEHVYGNNSSFSDDSADSGGPILGHISVPQYFSD